MTPNLPAQPTPFVGRVIELAEVARLLAYPACQLLTLVGLGGIGKTRLALKAAEQSSPSFADGAHFVPLASVAEAESIVPAIAYSMGISFYPNVEPEKQLLQALRTTQTLLVLDNFEHLLLRGGVDVVNGILQAAPDVKILVTSREPLVLQRETILHVYGMDYPVQATVSDATQYGAVQLLFQTARRVQPELAPTAETLIHAAHICRQVEGMPLAIVLAAAWIDTLSLAEISEEIERSLDFLETASWDMPERHHDFHAVFEPTWQMLSGDERTAFKKLTVFRGSFTREAAQAISGSSLRVLAALVSKSIVQRTPSGRYGIHRLLRQYGEEKLDAALPDKEAAYECCSTYYADFMHRHWERSKSSEQKDALDEVASEFDNLSVAWSYMLQRGQGNQVRKFVHMWFLLFFMGLRAPQQEGVPSFEQAERELRSGKECVETQAALGTILVYRGRFCIGTGMSGLEKGQALAEEGLALLRTYGEPDDLVAGLLGLSIVSFFAGDQKVARKAAEEGLQIAKGLGDRWGMAYLGFWVGTTMALIGEATEAKRIGEECLELMGQNGDLWLLGCVHAQLLGDIAIVLRDYADAKKQCLIGLRYFEILGEPWAIATTYTRLAEIATVCKDYQDAVAYFRHSMRLLETAGLEFETLETLFVVSQLFADWGKLGRAVEFLELILQHSATQKIIGEKAEGFRTHLQSRLFPALFAASRERGEGLMLENVAAQLLDGSEFEPFFAAATRTPDCTLSERESEVLHLIANGQSNTAIAHTLYLSIGTVKVHIRHIYEKLNAHSRTQAIAEARELGIL